MRTLSEFTAAIEMLLGQAQAQLSGRQLKAIGRLLTNLGGTIEASGELKEAFASASTFVGTGAGAGLPPASGMPQPVSGGQGVVTPEPPAPAPSESPLGQNRPLDGARPVPAYAPPHEDVDCEEAHLQRGRPARIDELRGSSVIFCERVVYYLGQIGAHANQIPAGDPVLGQKIGDCMLSIECLPGRRPSGGAFDVEENLSVAWQTAYDLMKELRERDLIDADDEQQILSKLGDRPGGALDEPDNSNENLRPAPKPAAMKIEGVSPMVPPGAMVLQPGQASDYVMANGVVREFTLSRDVQHPVVITPTALKTLDGLPAGVEVTEYNPEPDEEPDPAAAEAPNAARSS